MKTASRPPIGGGSPQQISQWLSCSQVIDLTLDIGALFQGIGSSALREGVLSERETAVGSAHTSGFKSEITTIF